jgi:predicted GIY-YIG superfamily endonuclease
MGAPAWLAEVPGGYHPCPPGGARRSPDEDEDPLADGPELGIIYLLHFEEPYRHARHYLGWTGDLRRRLALHRKGRSGARLMHAVASAGVPWHCVARWLGTRDDERAMKRRRELASWCPTCRAERLARRAALTRERRKSGKD